MVMVVFLEVKLIQLESSEERLRKWHDIRRTSAKCQVYRFPRLSQERYQECQTLHQIFQPSIDEEQHIAYLFENILSLDVSEGVDKYVPKLSSYRIEEAKYEEIALARSRSEYVNVLMVNRSVMSIT